MPWSLRLVLRGSCLLGALALASCTANQTIAIANDGSGTFVMHAEVSPLLRDYLASLAELSGNASPLKEGRVFDAAAIRKDFQSRPGIFVRKVSTPTSSVLDLELGFNSLQDLLRSQDALKDTGALALVDAGDRSTLRLHLDRATWSQLAGLFPSLRDPLVAQLGPQGSGQVTDDDYLAMIRFSMGEDAPGLLKKSFITMTIQPPGEIISQSGGTISGGGVVFRIPVLRILVLDRPLDYSVTWEDTK
ncbi:MAG: hypothetical protein ABSG21_00010 [Spirochaetia bacterium]|jgi:hypothetical protein